MPDNDALRRMLGEAESHVLSLVSAPGAEATRVGLRRRARKRAVAAALAVTLAVVGIGLSAWSSDPLPPTDPVPTAEPSDSPTPTVSPSTSQTPEGLAAPPSTACTQRYEMAWENTSLQTPGGKVKLLVTPDSQLCAGQKITVFWGAYRLNGGTWELFDTQTYSLDANRRSITFTVPLSAYCGGARVWFVHGDLKRETSYASNSSPYLTYTPRPNSGVIDYSMASPPCPS